MKLHPSGAGALIKTPSVSLKQLVREHVRLTDLISDHMKLREAMRETPEGATAWLKALEAMTIARTLVTERMRRLV